MTIQNIIDTYNYSVVTGCKLSKRASNELYEAILSHLNMNADQTVDPSKKNMSPRFVNVESEVPQDFMTFTGYRPHTKNLYGNYCELELLRILYLLRPDNIGFAGLYETTRQRIKGACFGAFCSKGECFEISIMALRFISTVFSEEKQWIDMYVHHIGKTIFDEEKKISKRSELMFCQVLSELRREQDGVILDDILAYIDIDHLHNLSRVSHAINSCILYSSLRRSVMAS